MKTNSGKVIVWVLLAALAAVVPLAYGLNLKDIARTLTQEPKHFQNRPSGSDTAAMSDDAYRGRAQEMRPDISVPPPAASSSTQITQNAPQEAPVSQAEQFITGLEQIASTAPSGDMDELPTEIYRPANSAQKVKWVPPPPGFLTGETYSFLVYREKGPVTPKLTNVLDNIHGSLMLDLTPFTLIVKPGKILVMLFLAKESYMNYTHRPSWSGASSDLQSDTMYIIEKTGFYALSVHELTHLYFDQFFLPKLSPLWLSEGMAVYMQVYATQKRPTYVDNRLRQIVQTGKLIPFEQMMAAETLKDYPRDQAEIWYTQAYSVVDYLLNTRSRDEFYKMCEELKNGAPMYQALYRAYGMPFNKVSTLQNVWLHDLQKAAQQGRLQFAPANGGKK